MNDLIFPKYMFLDFDGTLVDSIHNLYKSYENLLQFYSVEACKEDFSALNGPSILEIAEILKEKHKISESVEEIFQRYLKIIDEVYVESKPFEDSELFLSGLYDREIKMALVTSCSQKLCKPLIRKFGWEKYIDFYIWGDSVERSKPDPDIYLRALKESHVGQSEIIVIEDSVNGVESGVGAGLKVYGVSTSFKKEELIKAGASKAFKNLSSILLDVVK